MDTKVARGGAITLSVLLIVLTAAVLVVGNYPGPYVRAFLPISATFWATAELLTAFLLLSQFYVAGRLAYLLIAMAYALSGLLTIPYLVAFPGVVGEPATLADLQISPWLWAIWHCSLPIVIAAAHLIDPTLDRRIVARPSIGIVLRRSVAGVFVLASAITIGVIASREHIARIVMPGGHFTHDYSTFVAPAVVAANLIALLIVSFRLSRSTQLQMWVSVALLTSALDGILNATALSRFTISWYVGKLEALATASLLLFMLLFEVATLYRRLFDAASIDALTGLPNRRTFDSGLDKMLAMEGPRHGGLAMLVLDLDNFKRFNDTYGHALGDEVLRLVARVLQTSVLLPQDFVARYGGEEFVVVLPDTALAGARTVAERIRVAIGASPIALEDGSFAHITTSIGLAHATATGRMSGDDLFAAADRALYAAKACGRNCVVVGEEACTPDCAPESSCVPEGGAAKTAAA